MSSPSTKAVNSPTRWGSWRHQKASTNMRMSGTGDHSLQGSKEAIHTKSNDPQTSSEGAGRAKGAASMGCNAISEDRMGGLVGELMLDFLGIGHVAHVHAQHQEMPVAFGMGQGLGNGHAKTRAWVMVDLFDPPDGQAG